MSGPFFPEPWSALGYAWSWSSSAMNFVRYTLWIGLLIVLGGMGCSGGGSAPALPSEPAASPLASPFVAEDANQVEGALGVYHLELQPAQLTATLEPNVRLASAYGDEYDVDVTGFFTYWPCEDCFGIDAVGLNDLGQIVVDFGIRHPFPKPQIAAPQPNDRLDLHVFDVRAVFLRGTDGASPQSFDALAQAGTGLPSTLAIDNSGFLAGITIDGFTGAYDAYTDRFIPTQASIHPYVVMHEDTGQTNFAPDGLNGFWDPYNPTGYNVFPMGGGPYVRPVTFSVTTADAPLSAEVLVVANFGISALGRGTGLGQRANPVYFLPQFNMKAPWKLKLAELSNTLQEGNPAGVAEIEVKIYDWQHAVDPAKVVGGLDIDPAFPRDRLVHTSSIGGVRAQVLGVADPNDVGVEYLAGDGSPAAPLTFKLTIPNALDAAQGNYWGLVEIEDNYKSNGGTITGLSRDGATPFALGRPSTFHTFALHVEEPGQSPFQFGLEMSVFPPPEERPAGGPTTITADPFAYHAFVADNPDGGPASMHVSLTASGHEDARGRDIVTVSSEDFGANWSDYRLVRQGDYGRTGNQTQSALAVNTASGEGTVYLVYRDALYPSGSDAIVFQRGDDQGQTWDEAQIVENSGGLFHVQRTYPSIAALADGRLVVAWEQREYLGLADKIHWEASTDEGENWPIERELTASGTERKPQVIAMPAGVDDNGFYLLYRQNPLNTAPDLLCYTYPKGLLVPEKIIGILNEPVGTSTQEHRAAFCPTTGTLAVAQTLKSASTQGIYVTTLEWGNSTPSSAVRIAGGPGETYEHPAIVYRSNGAVLAAWNDNRSGLGMDVSYALSSDHGVNWSEPLTQIERPGDQMWPELLMDPESEKVGMLWWDASYGTDPGSLRLSVEQVD